MPEETRGGTGTRREGRELALKLLYREEVTGIGDGPIPDIEEAREEALAFAEAIVGGVRDHREEIDRLIGEASEHWEIPRMGAVDRTVLRIGTFELLCLPENPVGVVINEAVEIARKYSSNEGARFVNGVLDHVAHHVGARADELRARSEPDGRPRDGEKR